MLLSHHQNAGQNHNMKTVNRSFENVARLKCLETTEINQYLIHEEIKGRLISGNACCISAQGLRSSRLLPKKKTKHKR
jgi:hypothetical protein